ncbi:hypothetical protein [Pseudomonas sp.]|uniref:hypothetical protein n=1 Tax=Pseudomonas sp. TaxID=306 RepID=UPI0039827B37
MDIFLQNALAFPTLIFSFLLSLMMVYWLFAALGAVEIDVLDIEGDSALEGDGLQAEGLAGLLLKLGLGGVPITIVLTLLAMFSWVISYLIESLLLSHLPLGWLRYPLGLVVAVGVLFVAVPPAAALCKPLRKLFLKFEAPASRSFLGQTAVVRSSRVTLNHGEATLEDGGAGLILKVQADELKGFKRGDHVVLLEYLEAENAYRVLSEEEFNGI